MKNKKKPKTTPSIVQSTQSWIPIQDIRDGVVITKDGRYIKILEFSPINFLLRSSTEQDSILFSFRSMLKIAPCKLQFKVTSRKADIEKYLAVIRKEQKKERNHNCRYLQEEYMNLIETVGLREGVSRRFFVIFEYEPMFANQQGLFEDIVYELETTAYNIQNRMAPCGNELIGEEYEDQKLIELFYTLMNPKRSEHIGFIKHAAQIVDRYVTASGRTLDDPPYMPAPEFFSPKAIHFRHGKYVIIDGKYYAYAYVPSSGYPTQVLAGWLSPIVNAGEGIDVDIYLEKLPKDQAQRRLGQQIRINRARIQDTQDTNTDFDDLNNAISSGFHIKEGLSNNEDLYYLAILFTISGDNLKELEWKVSQLEKQLISMDMVMKLCRYQMEQAFLSSLPLCQLHKCIAKKSKRNVLTSGASSSYLFSSYEMCDENGILLGVNKANDSLVIVDIFNSRRYKNANIAILGTSGAGKTFTLQCLATRMRLKNIQVFIIAPLKGHEFKRACTQIGGEYIRISAGSSQCINILEIRKTDTSAHKLLDGEDTEGSILAEKVQKLHIFFSLLIPDITYEEDQILDETLIRVYGSKGITMDNESLTDPTNPSQYRMMPILGDVYQELSQNEKTKRMANILRPMVFGSANSFNRQTNVDLNNKYVVIDISSLTGNLLTIGMFVALDYVWDKIKENRTKKKAVFLDELWQLIGASSNRLAANFVLEIFKTIRGFGGSAIAATQDISDFFALDDGKYGKGIINNSKTKMILNLEMEEASHVQEILNLTDTETMMITKFPRGNGLVATNSNNVFVEFRASQVEKMLITTDREELEQLLEERKGVQDNGKGVIFM